MGFIYLGCFVAQESAHVRPAHGDFTKIQTGVKCVHRKGEEMKAWGEMAEGLRIALVSELYNHCWMSETNSLPDFFFHF